MPAPDRSGVGISDSRCHMNRAIPNRNADSGVGLRDRSGNATLEGRVDSPFVRTRARSIGPNGVHNGQQAGNCPMYPTMELS